MKMLLAISVFTLLSWVPCCSRAVEESVVSVYTAPARGAQLDVYGQIATNLAEKITSPFYRFFGINSTAQTTKRPFEHIELQDNTTTPERDVEELSAEALSKIDKKPEKITIFSTYLPPEKGKLELNETNEIDDDDDFDDEFSFDDVGQAEGRGPFVYLLELLGSVIQLLWGGFLAIFKPPIYSRQA